MDMKVNIYLFNVYNSTLKFESNHNISEKERILILLWLILNNDITKINKLQKIFSYNFLIEQGGLNP